MLEVLGLVTQVRPGQLVSSSQGRDTGRYYLVLSSLDDHFVEVTDGEYRGIENMACYFRIDGAKTSQKVRLTNDEIMSSLAEMINSIQEEPLLKGKEVG